MHPDSYDADAIQVLTPAEVVAKFEWTTIGELAHRYGTSHKLIERGFAACARVGVSPHYFVGRYLVGDKTIPFREDVDAAYRELGR